MLVGNGSSLHIKQIGSVLLATATHEPLLLNHALYVPQITKNLLSVSKLLADNDVTIGFLKIFVLSRPGAHESSCLKELQKECCIQSKLHLNSLMIAQLCSVNLLSTKLSLCLLIFLLCLAMILMS